MTKEEAIKILKRQADGYYPKTTEALIMAIKALEQQPIAWIVGKDNCKVAVMDMSIDKMQKICAIIGEEDQEPCEDAISRQAAIEVVRKWFDKIQLNSDICLDGIISLPSVISQPKTGRWIYDNFNWRCSECNEAPKTLGYVGTADFMSEHFKYCNHCGAKMESEG